MEFLIIIGLIFLNGIFSMTEVSLISARKFRLEIASKRGNLRARTALALADNPTKFLSTIQIGITLIGILLGVYSGETYGKELAQFIGQYPIFNTYAHNIAIAVIVITITYLTIVFGELIPKRLGLLFPESIAIFLSKPMYIISYLASPFVWLLSVSNDIVLKLLNIKGKSLSKITEEEIKFIIKESAKGGEIQRVEQDIVERVFELGDMRVNSLATHRSDISYLNESDDLDTIREKINYSKHSIYPVCRYDNLDEIIGIVTLNDLFAATITSPFELKKYTKPPLYVNEKIYAYRLLELFKKEKTHFAIVVDEYGATKGIITMDDVLDSLVGNVSEQRDIEYQIVQRSESSWLVDGQYSVFEFMKYFDLEMGEDNESQFVTIAGLFIHKFTRLPNVGDKLTLNGYELEVIDKDGQRIDKILVTKL